MSSDASVSVNDDVCALSSLSLPKFRQPQKRPVPLIMYLVWESNKLAGITFFITDL
jgi:hypothetical protein